MSRKAIEDGRFRMILVSEKPGRGSGLSRLAHGSGFQVREAAPAEALQLALEIRPQLALLEWGSPDARLLELCSSMRGEPRLARTCLFAVFDREPSLEGDVAFFQAGGDGYMVKPVGEEVVKGWLRAMASLQATRRWLKGRERPFRTYMDVVGVALLVLTPDGRVAVVNRRGLEVLGLPEEEVVGKNWFYHFLPAEERLRIQRHFFDLFSSGAGTHSYAENRVLRPDGEERILAWRNTTIHDGKGRAIATLSSGDDITVRKSVERSLREALARREELELIVNRSPVVAFLWKAEKGFPVEFVSENVRQFGYRPEDLVSRRVLYVDLIHPEDRERVTAEVVGFIREGREEFRQEYRLLTANGEERWVEDRTWVRRDDEGRVTHYQGIIMDVSDRLQYQRELEELNKELEAFASTLSHDLKNPLGNALGYAMTLSARCSHALDDLGREMVEGVLSSIRKVEEMVDRMLEYAVSGRKAMVARTISMEDLVERVLQGLRDNGTLEGVRVLVRGDLPVVQGDPVMMHRVVENLVSNAAKYRSPVKEPLVEIGSLTVGGSPALFVRDNGVGIREEDLERVFEPLVRTEDTRNRPGYGLGLAIAKRCVEGWGGRIWAESEYGKGSTFYFTLPS